MNGKMQKDGLDFWYINFHDPNFQKILMKSGTSSGFDLHLVYPYILHGPIFVA